MLSFISQPKDVINAKFCAESNGCVGGYWKWLHGVAIQVILVFISNSSPGGAYPPASTVISYPSLMTSSVLPPTLQTAFLDTSGASQGVIFEAREGMNPPMAIRIISSWGIRACISRLHLPLR